MTPKRPDRTTPTNTAIVDPLRCCSSRRRRSPNDFASININNNGVVVVMVLLVMIVDRLLLLADFAVVLAARLIQRFLVDEMTHVDVAPTNVAAERCFAIGDT